MVKAIFGLFEYIISQYLDEKKNYNIKKWEVTKTVTYMGYVPYL